MAENRCDGEKYFSRYYFGKVVASTLDLHPTIIGAAKDRELNSMEKAFYAYIDTIRFPIKLRKQYNSWYDNMLNITPANLKKSFEEIYTGFETYGLHLDAYVVDDGWVDYESFWEFNEKFPDGLQGISDFVRKIKSSLGLWIGPRGGYNGTEKIMSNWLKAHPELKLGSQNSVTGDVNVGDPNYLENLQRKMLEYQKRYDISYWKIDGMLKFPDKKDESGPFRMHTMTEVYERLINLLDALREEREGKDFFLNLTSYVNPSPWFLKWVNSLWIQFSMDVNYTENAGTDLQRMLTYRDSQYYELLFERNIKLPLNAIYNHEPIYGLEANRWHLDHQLYGSVDEFKEYLLFIATRGNALWEFYYSYKMFDEERWKANAEAVRWLEDNYFILKNSRFFGTKPNKMSGIYGYKCESDDQDSCILSFRNLSSLPCEYYFEEELTDLQIVTGSSDQIHANKKGWLIKLKPKEILIIKGKK